MWNTRFAGRPAGSLKFVGNKGTPYVYITINYVSYRAHRLIWKLMTGKEPMTEVDHQDCDSTNNKWNNLREATRRQGAGNTRGWKKVDHAKGVRRRKTGLWTAQIGIDGRLVHLGNFKN
jgi:hypothetical protein